MLIRKKRSSRKASVSIISRRSRWVAQRTRTSTRNGSFSPTRRISPDSRNRSSLTCTLLSSSPTSSRNRVPPLATSNSPLRLVVGAGEGPLAVAEELALDEVLGQGPAVDRDEGVAGPLALVVEVPGDQLLAGAGLAQDQDPGVGRRDHLDLAADRLHRRGVADQQRRPLDGLEPGLEGGRLVGQVATLGDPGEQDLQLGPLAGLGQVVEGARAGAPGRRCRRWRARS